MYNANEMRQVAEEAKTKQKILKKCAAQQFFAQVYPEIEDAAAEGEFNTLIAIPRELGFAVREIREIFQGFGYEWKVERQNCFIMIVRIQW